MGFFVPCGASLYALLCRHINFKPHGISYSQTFTGHLAWDPWDGGIDVAVGGKLQEKFFRGLNRQRYN